MEMEDGVSELGWVTVGMYVVSAGSWATALFYFFFASFFFSFSPSFLFPFWRKRPRERKVPGVMIPVICRVGWLVCWGMMGREFVVYGNEGRIGISR